MAGKFANHYCPHCLHPVDPDNGDHWHCPTGMEYESDEPNNPPLTELQMMDKKLENVNEALKRNKADLRSLRKNRTALLLKISNRKEPENGY
jgi:hypothetical protein